MAYSITAYLFRGLSTDTKPTEDPGEGRGSVFATGSRFIEIDTGDMYDWNGSAWIAAVADFEGGIGGAGGGGEVEGDVAHDAADSGNPVKVGFRAVNPDAPPADVTINDRANGISDLKGRQLVYLATTLDSTNDSIAALGNVAHDAADSGNPVKVGGKARTGTPTAVADADRVDAWFSPTGAQVIAPLSIAALDDSTPSYWQYANQGSLGVPGVGLTLYSGTGNVWNRQRNNHDVTALASAARTVTTSSADLTNYNARGVHVQLNVTSAGTGSITLSVQGKDPLSGTYYSILDGVAVTTNGINVYKVYPGIVAVANGAASDVLPRTWRVTVTANNANSITYSVNVSYVL